MTGGGDKPARLRLRQVAALVGDLEMVAADLVAVLGARAIPGGPGAGRYGLASRVFPIGDSFLELVSPEAPGSAERLLARRGQDGGYMVCLQTTELAAVERRIAEAGVRVVEDLPYEGGRTLHLHPKDVGGAILSVDATLPAWRWPWVGDDRAPPLVEAAGLEIVGLELRSVRPAALARRWAGLVGEGAAAEDSVWRVPLPGCELRFRAAPEEGAGGLCGLVVRALDPDAVRGRAAARGRLGPGGTIRLAGLDVELVSDLPA